MISKANSSAMVKKLASYFEELEQFYEYDSKYVKTCIEDFLKSPWVKDRIKKQRGYTKNKEDARRKLLDDVEKASHGNKNKVLKRYSAEHCITEGTAKTALARARKEKKQMDKAIKEWSQRAKVTKIF